MAVLGHVKKEASMAAKAVAAKENNIMASMARIQGKF